MTPAKCVEVPVNLDNRSYSLFIGADFSVIKSGLTALFLLLPVKQMLIVTNATIGALYLNPLLKIFEELGISAEIVQLPDGEVYKTFESVQVIYQKLLEKKMDKGAMLCALGGGVIGDLTGFAAATYRRGINYIQIPTSLLAQVDAALGGKNGFNLPEGKNMVGTIYQPKAVLVNIDFLKTLPLREYRAGLAEVIKYGLIADKVFFQWLEKNMEALLKQEQAALLQAVTVACQHKARIIEADEWEQNTRALLNFGHSFGHALESITNYKTFLHGEAVAIGMALAVRLSVLEGDIQLEDETRIVNLLTKAGLTSKIPPYIDRGQFQEALFYDKKIRNKALYLVLLKEIGQAYLTSEFDHHHLNKTLEISC